MCRSLVVGFAKDLRISLAAACGETKIVSLGEKYDFNLGKSSIFDTKFPIVSGDTPGDLSRRYELKLIESLRSVKITRAQLASLYGKRLGLPGGESNACAYMLAYYIKISADSLLSMSSWKEFVINRDDTLSIIPDPPGYSDKILKKQKMTMANKMKIKDLELRESIRIERESIEDEGLMSDVPPGGETLGYGQDREGFTRKQDPQCYDAWIDINTR